jgi:hypothetical protein
VLQGAGGLLKLNILCRGQFTVNQKGKVLTQVQLNGKKGEIDTIVNKTMFALTTTGSITFSLQQTLEKDIPSLPVPTTLLTVMKHFTTRKGLEISM